MKRLTDRELEKLLDDTESDRVERKESFKGDTPKKSRQTVCAFANDFPNHNTVGILFIEAKDNGTPSGVKLTDQLLLSLADMKTDGNILPLPVLSVEKRVLKGAEMAVVSAMYSKPLVIFKLLVEVFQLQKKRWRKTVTLPSSLKPIKVWWSAH